MNLGPLTTPGTYEWLVADLLHDQFVRWQQAQIDTYINQARVQVVKDTGCLRTLQPSFITTGIEQYLFGQVCGIGITSGGTNYTAPTLSITGGGGVGAAATLTTSGGVINGINFTSFGAGYTSNPTLTVTDGSGTGAILVPGILSANTYDVLAVNVFWGTERYSLQWAAFRLFSAWYRPFQAFAYQRQPGWWSTYGDNSIYIAPVPDQTYQVEFDTVILPTNFAVGDTTTPEQLPALVQDCVPFYAAYLAKRNAKNFGESESFLQDYRRKVLEARGAYVGRIPDVYQSQ